MPDGWGTGQNRGRVPVSRRFGPSLVPVSMACNRLILKGRSQWSQWSTEQEDPWKKQYPNKCRTILNRYTSQEARGPVDHWDLNQPVVYSPETYLDSSAATRLGPTGTILGPPLFTLPAAAGRSHDPITPKGEAEDD